MGATAKTSWADFEDDFPESEEKTLDDGTILRTTYRIDADGKHFRVVEKLRPYQEKVNVNAEARKGMQTFGLEGEEDEKYREDSNNPTQIVAHDDEDREVLAGDVGPFMNAEWQRLFKNLRTCTNPNYEHISKTTAEAQRPIERGYGIHMRTDGFKLRVTNLSDTVTTQELENLFRNASPDEKLDVFIPVNKDTGERRGFAFVTYRTKYAADKAIQVLDRHGLNQMLMGVAYARPARTEPL
eukprot:GHVO01040776.1.p1 GENE.GHVO01040776.1~~GHVO01040776.1.p1  ORF type:complete len:241 (-),score=44.82 GHVO01040776.1:246-968(-)